MCRVVDRSFRNDFTWGMPHRNTSTASRIQGSQARNASRRSLAAADHRRGVLERQPGDEARVMSGVPNPRPLKLNAISSSWMRWSTASPAMVWRTCSNLPVLTVMS
jgi:hypothetical protein